MSQPRYKLLTKRTNEEFLAYLEKLIEEKTTLLRVADAKIVDTKKKIGKARMAFNHKIVHKPMANSDRVTKLAKKVGVIVDNYPIIIYRDISLST